MLLEALSTARDLGRLQEIASVLLRHGLGDVVRRLKLASFLERAGRVVHWKGSANLTKPPHVRVREALEELGPTFVKLGQILAGRSDLLPPVWTEELSHLHEGASPVDLESILAQLTEDLGAPPEEVFASFEREPLAAASIAQIHRASLADGTQVVLKVRRPGIEDVVRADLGLLLRLAEEAEQHMPELRRFRPVQLVREFARSLRNEIDLRIEAKNARRLRENLRAEPELFVPRVYPEWTRERLCVLDFVAGRSLASWVRSRERQRSDGPRIAALGARAVLRMVFVDGCFHADPHPGNVILRPDGHLGLVDFGMLGVLTDSRRLEFLDLLMAIVAQDSEAATDLLLEWSPEGADADALRHDCAAFIDRYHGLPLAEIDATEVLRDLTSVLRDNGLFLPHDVALLLKVFVTLDGLGRELDPNFVMASYAEPFARAAWTREHSPTALLKRGRRELRSLWSGLPRDLRRLTRAGGVRFRIDVNRLEDFGKRIERSTNRLTVGLITAALIVGTSISLTVSGGPKVLGLPLFGFLGFGSSILGGVWLLWSILRSGKRS